MYNIKILKVWRQSIFLRMTKKSPRSMVNKKKRREL
jgi:hypothetical protein